MKKEAKKASANAKKKGMSFSEKVLNSKVMIWITIIASVLTIVGFLQATVSNAHKKGMSVSLNNHDRTLKVGMSDTLKQTVKPAQGTYEYIWKSDDTTVALVSHNGIVKALKPGLADITLTVKANNGETVHASCRYRITAQKPAAAKKGNETPAKENTQTKQVREKTAPKPSAQPSAEPSVKTIRLDYATYSGQCLNGEPHGNGTLTFHSNHLIPGTIDCEASAGETVKGTFRDGKVNSGIWQRNDGTRLFVKSGQKSAN